MKVNFDQVFKINKDGTLSPKMDIRFNGDYRRAGSSIFPGSTLGRLDIGQHIGEPVEVEKDGDSAIIMGFYPAGFRLARSRRF